MATGQTLSAPGATADAWSNDGVPLLLVALACALLFHGGLLPFTHENTYDAFIHMFFGDHYYRSWFDPWEPRWYTGFLTTSYPPGTHMAIGALMHVMSLRAAFVTVQLFGLLLLTVGVFRFSLLWVAPRAAGFASIALVISSSISETIHIFGQLPTIFSLGVFLNGLPYVYRWIVIGRWANFLLAVLFGAATTAAHHVTTLFGTILFIVPLGLHCLRAVAELNPLPPRAAPATGLRGAFRRPARPFARPAAWLRRFVSPVARGLLLAVLLVAGIVVTILPYWIWSVNDPITQVPIPHGSRESFIARPDMGLVFFLIPWGLSLLFLPYAWYKGLTSRLWPLAASLALCFVLGTGGTTPISRAILRGAFDILTLDRFTFWGSILILPFLGLMIDALVQGRSGKLIAAAFGRGTQILVLTGIFTAMVVLAVSIAIMPTSKPTQPEFIDPEPIVQFMSSDDHDQWRYLTLGFGDQFAYLSARMEAQSIDGNYHSARRLPELMRFSVERLENAKYLGVPGLGSLQQFLTNADTYHLKYVFSNDAFYDPLLHFSGWTRLIRLQNGIVVWEKPDVDPLPLLQPRRDISQGQRLMWGLLPPTMLLSAFAVLIGAALRRSLIGTRPEYRPLTEPLDGFGNPARVRRIVSVLAILLVLGVTTLGALLWQERTRPATAEEVITAYFTDLDFRRFGPAYDRLDPVTRDSPDDVLFQLRWQGGLIASYGKLLSVKTNAERKSPSMIDWTVTLDWLTALDTRVQVLAVRTVLRDGHWYIVPTHLRQVQAPLRILTEERVNWAVPGRRQARPDTDLHRDQIDRPKVTVPAARLVQRGGKLFLVGSVTNIDVVPAAISLTGELRGITGNRLMRQGQGTVGGERLRGGETSGFAIPFAGVLSLTEAAKITGFDPTLYIPPELPEPPAIAALDARALVGTSDVYRGVSLNGARIKAAQDGLILTGLAVNTGTETASVVRLTALLYGPDGRPLWAGAGFVDINIYPGQSAPFSMPLPDASEITVLAEVSAGDITVNGSGQPVTPPIDPSVASIPLNGLGGYSALRLSISSMTHDPQF